MQRRNLRIWICASWSAAILGDLEKLKGFTQESFAEASGFTQHYISDLERGRRNPTVVTLFELASTLGISHVDLVVPDDEARSERTKSGKRN